MDDLGEAIELRRDVRTLPGEVENEVVERDDADDSSSTTGIRRTWASVNEQTHGQPPRGYSP
ncbi:hypothetical protein [Halomicrococcus sp. SG-WS-1]|uniref:hypothetical protein n=1 Tax=Halomicrococcus sp. SG-WS-1 TaxID=3439057 RepID=UPI003F7AFF19